MQQPYIVQQSCWPYSGKRYQVWCDGVCLLETDSLIEANIKKDAKK